MIGKNTIKRIHSLSVKKFRQKEQLFLVEGDKNVMEVVGSGYRVEQIFATREFLSEYGFRLNESIPVYEVTGDDISKASLLKNPQHSLALCHIPDTPELPSEFPGRFSLYLDGIQDPGNLGTIIRICDWFGIENLFCSPDTADLYNPKVIQASMGSFCRIRVWQTSFEPVYNLANHSNVPVFGAFLNGNNLYDEKLPSHALLVLGNEGNGIRDEIGAQISKRVKIPSFASNRAESLNVAVAAGIICAEFSRQNAPGYSK